MHINLFILDMYNNFFILKTLQTFLISVLFSFVYAIFHINFGMKLHRYQLFYCALDYPKCFALEYNYIKGYLGTMFIVLLLHLLWDFEIYNNTDPSIKTIYFLCFDKLWNYRNKIVIIEKYVFGCSLYLGDLTSFLRIIVVTWFKSGKDIDSNISLSSISSNLLHEIQLNKILSLVHLWCRLIRFTNWGLF